MAAFTNPSRLTLIALCAAIFGLGQFHRAAGSVFTPVLMDRFALSATAISGLVSAMFTAAVLAQIPLGVALDRYGPRLMLCCSMVVIAIGTALFAVGQDYETILAARIVIGLGTASLGASSYVIVARSFPEREFGYANGMIITLGGLGGLTGTYPLAMALSSAGWTASFAAVGAMTLVLALMVAWIVETPATGGAAAREGPKQGYLSLLRMPEMRRILVMGLATFAPITTITGIWGGPFLQDALGFTPQSAGAVLLLLSLGPIVSAFVFGQLDRRVARRKAMILIAAGGSVLSLSALALVPGLGVVPTVGLLLAMIVCQQFYIPLGAHMRRIVPTAMMGRASILLSLVGVAAIPLMQTGFGAILDLARAQGFDTAQQFRFGFGAMAVMIACCAMVYATAQHADPEGSGR